MAAVTAHQDPHTRHSEAYFTSQLAELLAALDEARQPVDLVGYSMGGGIAAHFAKTYPCLVSSLTLLSPVSGSGQAAVGLFTPPENSLTAQFLFWAYHHTPDWCTKWLRASILSRLVEDRPEEWSDPSCRVRKKFASWMDKRALSEREILVHSVFQSLRDFKPLFAGAAYNYGAFGGHVAEDSSAAYAFPVFLGWGARDTGPSTGTKYARRFLFVRWNGAAYGTQNTRYPDARGAVATRERRASAVYQRLGVLSGFAVPTSLSSNMGRR